MRFRMTLIAILTLVAASLVPAGASASTTPYLDHVAAALRHHAPGTEGKVWWISHGNTLPADWLLQTPNCWGSLRCGEPPPGGAAFLERITQMVAGAQRSIDFAGLFPPPEKLFREAIVAGLRQAIQSGYRPTVRFLIGVFPGKPFERPGAYVRQLSADVGGVLPIEVAYMSTHRERQVAGIVASSWDHSKILDIDGRTAIVGGTNWWTSDYLETAHPVNDLSMQVDGPAAADVSKFGDLLWGWTCAHRHNPLYVYYASHGLSGCGSDLPTLPVIATGNIPVLTVGRLGNGIEVPGEAGRRSPPIAPPPLRGNKCTFLQRDYSQTNDDRAYEYRNPGEDALRALIESAHHSIFISQQDLLSCRPKAIVATEAYFDERVFATLGTKIAEGVPIKIVVSGDHEGGYSNGYSLKDVARALTKVVERRRRISYRRARRMVCRGVGLSAVHNGPAATWPDGSGFANHAKVVAVDDQAFYIGSENLYPARLQELGEIVESHAAAAVLKSEYLDPMWRWSRGYALIDPRGACGRF
jgi:phosphatidylserine/phosphatidylglycerophosphate/cardiolipin synthase-like enzyme